MMRQPWVRAVAAGWLGGLIGNAALGIAFSTAWLKSLLFDPRLQSAAFIELALERDVAISVAGLVLLSGIYGALYAVLAPAIPGRTTLRKGLFWGVAIWVAYWLPQEWFVYVTLLREPIALALVELAVLLGGSLLQGLVIAALIEPARRCSSR